MLIIGQGTTVPFAYSHTGHFATVPDSLVCNDIDADRVAASPPQRHLTRSVLHSLVLKTSKGTNVLVTPSCAVLCGVSWASNVRVGAFMTFKCPVSGLA